MNVTYVKDKTVIVRPTDPKNPTDPVDPTNPDGPKYPNGVSEKDLNKTVSRTITYTGADKNPASVTQTGTYTRTATVDAKTGELLGYGDWILVTSADGNNTNDGFTAVTSPKVLGYTADKNATAVTLGNDAVTNFKAGSTDVTVTYTKDGTVEVTTPTDPTQPVDPSNPDGPKMPEITADDLLQTVTRTITYKVNASNDPNTPAAPATVTQTTSYKRSAIIDLKTGEILRYTDWIVNGINKFVAVDSPVVENYQADPACVSEITLSNNEINSIHLGEKTSHFNQTVSYNFVGTVTTTKDPDGGTTTVTKNPNGDVTDVNKTWPDGDKTHVHVDINTGRETVTETPKDKGSLPEVTVDPGQTVTVGQTTVHNDEPKGVVTLTHDSGNDKGSFVTVVNKDGSTSYSYAKDTTDNTGNTSKQISVQKIPNVTTNAVAITSTKRSATNTKKTNTKNLPQTDEQTNETDAIIGMSLLGMILSLVGIKWRKHERD